jgi:hypothetical protein
MVAALICGLVASAHAATSIEGLMTSDGVTGQPGATPAGWDDNHDSFPLGEDPRTYLGQLDVGHGAAGVPYHVPPGWYTIPKQPPPNSFPGGTYALFTIGFNAAPAFSFRMDIDVPSAAGTLQGQNLNTPAHYSVMYNESYTEWASDPWVWGTDFYQTFVATTPDITRLATRLAGKGGDHQSMTLNYAIHEVTASSPSTWPRISDIRSVFLDNNMDPIIHLLWVPYRSSELQLNMGQTYAARWWRAPGSSSPDFAICARPDTGDGYTSGQLYAGNTAMPAWDAYAYISGGELGTIVNHAPLNIHVGPQAPGGVTAFGQTFVASGTSVAAAEAMYITGDGTPPVYPIEFRVYNGFGGAPIGPAKTCYGVPGHYEARAAVIWEEGDVPTTIGETYYLEWRSPSPVSTYFMSDDVPGGAYADGTSQGISDLIGVIAEYLAPSPEIELSITELDVKAEYGVNRPSDVFTVRNSGGEPLNYILSDNMGWLTLSPLSGSSTGEADPITVNYATATMWIGTYTGTITVSDDDASNSPQTIPVSLRVYIPGDFDDDGDVDMENFGHFQACLTGPSEPWTDPACEDADLDGDTFIDAGDFAIFQSCLSGANVLAQPGCSED